MLHHFIYMKFPERQIYRDRKQMSEDAWCWEVEAGAVQTDTLEFSRMMELFQN